MISLKLLCWQTRKAQYKRSDRYSLVACVLFETFHVYRQLDGLISVLKLVTLTYWLLFCSSSKYITDSANHCHCLINVVVDLKPSSDMKKLPSAKTAKAAYSVYRYFVLILVMMLIMCLMSTSFYPERQFI